MTTEISPNTGRQLLPTGQVLKMATAAGLMALVVVGVASGKQSNHKRQLDEQCQQPARTAVACTTDYNFGNELRQDSGFAVGTGVVTSSMVIFGTMLLNARRELANEDQ